MKSDFAVGSFVLAPSDFHSGLLPGKVLAIIDRKQIAYIRYTGCDPRQDNWVLLPLLKIDLSTNLVVKKRKGDYISDERNDFFVRNIETIQFGDYIIKCWYYSPYPPSFIDNMHMYICDTCLLYFCSQEAFRNHSHVHGFQRPPGIEIYRCGNVSLFEVHGAKNKLFCQCLSLLSRFFLKDVAVFYDISSFNYYVLCECDENGAHIVAFFSRDNKWDGNHILACIMVLPPFQNRGYGTLLISIAYEMAKRRGIIGTPEKPLSDMGKIAFSSYWKNEIIRSLQHFPMSVKTLDDIALTTWISKPDLRKTLTEMNLITSKRGPILNANQILKMKSKGLLTPKPSKFAPEQLFWT